jgi:hypothetical protein
MFERFQKYLFERLSAKFSPAPTESAASVYGRLRDKIYEEITDENERARALVALDREHGLIDEDRARLKILDLDLAEKKITEMEYERQVANIRGNPWMNLFVVQEDGENAIMIVDYNQPFVAFLQKNNYDVSVPDRAVKQYVRLLSDSFAPEADTGISFETDVDPQTGVKFRR